MNDPVGIELFSWPLCWAGLLGAGLLDLTRWASRLMRNRMPQHWGKHLAASFVLLVAGGGTAGLFGGYLSAAWMAAAIGAGAPAVLRTLATLGPKIVEKLAAARPGIEIGGSELSPSARSRRRRASLRRALELDTDDGAAHTNLKRLNEAEASYRRALELDPDDAAAHTNLGNVLWELKRLDEAEASLRRALELRPGALAHYNLSIVLRDQERLDEAEASLRQCRLYEMSYGRPLELADAFRW